jgi:hypothetical protein
MARNKRNNHGANPQAESTPLEDSAELNPDEAATLPGVTDESNDSPATEPEPSPEPEPETETGQDAEGDSAEPKADEPKADEVRPGARAEQRKLFEAEMFVANENTWLHRRTKGNPISRLKLRRMGYRAEVLIAKGLCRKVDAS